MSGALLGYGTHFALDQNNLLETINLLHRFETSVTRLPSGFLGTASLNNTPLKGERRFSNDRWELAFAGDILETSVPWISFITILESEQYHELNSIRGIFCLIAYNKQKGSTIVITDHLGQFPVFYLTTPDLVCVSTDLATFSRLPEKLEFNVGWLYDLLFFNIPFGTKTYFKLVNRVPAASVLHISGEGHHPTITSYRAKHQKENPLLRGEEALEAGYNTFDTCIPDHFQGSIRTAIALSGGWDGRTNLAFCPDPRAAVPFTYGIPTCIDLISSDGLTRKLGFPHKEILFDETFLAELPKLIYETVFLSSGMEKITRATVLYSYRELTSNGQDFPLVISGIGYGNIFRGGIDRPSGISNDLYQIFVTGEHRIDEKIWRPVFGSRFPAFREHIAQSIDEFEREYGQLNDTETHLDYMVYEMPKRFCGELLLAKYYTTVRVPAWDDAIIDLAYSIENSTLSFSHFRTSYRNDDIRRFALQAYMFQKKGDIYSTYPIRGYAPHSVLKGKFFWYLNKFRNLGTNLVLQLQYIRGRIAPLEDWSTWCSTIFKDDINELLFSENTRITTYITPEYLTKQRLERNTFQLSRLASVEIVLRLIETKWTRFW
jgi:asparagine synthetase B (glutamine-hydrolysing)